MEKIEICSDYLVSFLNDVLIFRHLTEEQKHAIVKISDAVLYDDNEVIIKQDELSPYFYVVIDGKLNVSINSAEKKNVFVGTIGDKEIFGEAAIFLNEKRIATVTATAGTVKLLRFERTKFLNFIKHDPQAGSLIMFVIVYGLFKKLKEANQELAFERKSFTSQKEVDNFINEYFK